jgi:hypothetical protein
VYEKRLAVVREQSDCCAVGTLKQRVRFGLLALDAFVLETDRRRARHFGMFDPSIDPPRS